MKLLLGDCLEKLKELEDNSVDAVVTDPPYGLSFMGKDWDKVKATKETQSQVVKGLGAGMKMTTLADNIEFEKWVTEWSMECMRVLKPGGYMLAFGGSRMYHRLASGVENAGFEIRDQMMWIYGSGFPKSRDIGKDIEKIKVGGKANLTQVGTKPGLVATNHNDKAKTSNPSGFSYRTNQKGYSEVATDRTQVNGEIPVYEITNDYKGWGTALKPAHEPIVMARKPFKGNVAQNVLEWGTGGINVDGCRVGNERVSTHSNGKGNTGDKGIYGTYGNQQGSEDREGRFPANIIFDEEAGKLLDEQSGITSQGHWPKGKTKGFGEFGGGESSYEGVGPKDKEKGGASRFFYCPKANKSDRDEGLTIQAKSIKGRDEGQDKTSIAYKARPTERQNIHPTVKPTELMAYLIRLVTPKGGLVLDPFMGSGSTGKAAVREGMDFIGIEREEEYMEIAKQRIGWELNKKQIEESKSKFW